ncbi:hypothetical protein HD593_006472 [Nonomuraea rubra]|uniref:Uncharacterized protein n=1 Tax=Nonomuraea rubra TaxID=46180 RepID=A0A7X0NY40_9ACTN|nr:hypothetical protein [Nonomuraea rubra]MBB6551677.1 hypothetical protein [Nonomuraea rubra]
MQRTYRLWPTRCRPKPQSWPGAAAREAGRSAWSSSSSTAPGARRGTQARSAVSVAS